MTAMRVIYVLTSADPALAGAVAVASAPVPEAVSPFLPPNCQLLRRIASAAMPSLRGRGSGALHLRHCELSARFGAGGVSQVGEGDVRKLLDSAGVRRLGPSGGKGAAVWHICPPGIAIAAIGYLKRRHDCGAGKNAHGAARRTAAAAKGHGAADALDWREAVSLIRSLRSDGRYRDCMLVAAGCYLGLRVSDLLRLRWGDLTGGETLTITETKTGKRRTMRINATLSRLAAECRDGIGADGGAVILAAAGTGRAISRQRADQILKECKARYGIRSAATFSTHSLRKTFGRQVWLGQCEKGRGEQALILLCDVFGHSSVSTTKRYLGIRQEEILAVYDTLQER